MRLTGKSKMKDYFELREQFLTEAKVGVTKLKAGMSVELNVKGSMAKRSGYSKGDNPFGDGVKLKVLGFGIVPFGKTAEKKHVITKSVDEFNKKYKADMQKLKAQDDNAYERGLTMYSGPGKLRIMANDLADNGTLGSSVKPGFVSYIVQVMGGEMKGQFKYLYVSASLNDKWCVYLSDDTEFDLFT
tara:strand:- start:2350 stop:2910 length:561 start_codon:yes stop_codon:yes gene_type:complete